MLHSSRCWCEVWEVRVEDDELLSERSQDAYEEVYDIVR